MIRTRLTSIQSDMIVKILAVLVISSITIQTFLHFYIPLMPHFLNDPAWYHMYAHHLFTGEFINETMYPSFNDPILYYCPLGYPALHMVSMFIDNLTFFQFAGTLKFLQFLTYLASSYAMYWITKRYSTKILGLLAWLFYLWFTPFFNYAHLAMSETWFIGVLFLTLFLFIKGVEENSKRYLIFMFLVSGYLFLIRPVAGVILPIGLALIWLTDKKINFKYSILFISLFCVFPVIQSSFNKKVYNTWSVREGLGWNLYNRVVKYDNHFPEHSPSTEKLKLTLKDPSFQPIRGWWWDISGHLSRNYGLGHKQAQQYCLETAIEGIKEYPAKYFLNTSSMAFLKLPVQKQSTVFVFERPDEYKQALENYRSPHHNPLVNKLLNQSFKTTKTAIIFNKLYFKWNNIFTKLSTKVFFTILYLILIFELILSIEVSIKRKKLNNVGYTLITILPFAMSFGTCLFEVLHNRYYLPSVALSIIVLFTLVDRLFLKTTER